MKKIYFLLLFCLIPCLSFGQDLLITGLIDGPLSGGTPKAIELYAINDISDLSIYGIGSANNGGGTDGEEFTFPTVSINAGDYIYVASETTQFTNFFGFAPDYTSGAASVNGDDAVELFQNGLVVDVFGDINTDGTGQPWEYLDGWTYRTSNTGPDGNVFTIANWSFSGPNALDGETSNGTAASPFPIGTYGGSTGAPVENPTSFTATSNGTSEINLTWGLNSNADNVLIAFAAGSAVAGVPEDGTAYTIGNTLAGGGTIIYVGDLTSFDHTGLTENTNYQYKIWSVDSDTSYSSGIITDATTDSSTPPDPSGIIITGVIDGPLSGGIPKAVELKVINDIPDLSAYGIGSANNGGGSDGQEFTFPMESANAGDVIYIASEETGFTEFFGFAPNYTSGALAVNGDDAIELFLNGSVVDVFGDINIDGTGQPWEYLDGWAYRKDNTGPDGTTFILENWIFSGTNVLDGATTNDNVSSPFPLGSYGPDLIITGVLDGPLSGGVPKAIEFYVNADIPDLSLYGFGSANNGGGSDGQEFTFPAITVSKGDFIYVASETTGFTTYFGFAPDYTSGAASINGDDAIELFLEGEVADVFGDINTDGSGQAWEYLDGWAYRNDNTGPDGSSFIISNWSFSSPNALDGTTSNDTAGTPFPIGTYGPGGTVVMPPDLISISEARSISDGEAVMVTGVLTVSDQFAGSAYLQDGTGGIAIFDELVHGDGVFQIGDSITVTGVRSSFNNQIQISPVTNVENNGIPNQQIEPLTITLSELTNHPGELVRITNPTFPKPGDILFGNSNYLVTDSSGSGEMRIDNDVEEIVGLGQPDTCEELIGVVGRFENTFQLLPRLRADIACAGAYVPPSSSVTVSKDKTLDVVTWNIEWFGDEGNSPAAGNPMSDSIQKDSVKTVLAALNADVYAVQEISDDALFAQLISEIPGYDYVLSPAVSRPNEPGVKQKVGFIYNTNTVSLLSTKVLLESIHPLYNGGDDSALVDYPSTTDRFYASGRLPFLMTADVTIDGETKQFDFIALHARANNSSDAQNRYDMRKYDVEVLKDSLDVQFPNSDFILLGDFNDDVDETVADITSTISSYEDYVADTSNYNIVSSILSENGFRSFVFRENMIDHIVTSDEVEVNYIDETATVHYEFYDNDYASTASDHFPVSARFQLQELSLDSLTTSNVTCNAASDGTSTAIASGGIKPYTYEWSDGQSTATASGLAAGTYTVVITDHLGTSVTDEVTITEPGALEITTTEDTTVYLGYGDTCTTVAVTSVTGGTGPYDYEWSTGETTVSVEVCPEESTTYSVTVTDANGCATSVDIVITVEDISCGNNPRFPKVQICHRGRTICVPKYAVNWFLRRGATLGSCSDNPDELFITRFKAYPNPFKDILNIKFESSLATEADILIYNYRGTLVASRNELLSAGENTISLDLGHLRKGFYYLKIVSGGEVKRAKIIIKS